MSVSIATADEIISRLDLRPHPEGGHYRETFRDAVTLPSARSCSTAIYYLLKRGEISRWHRVDAVEVWHWYAGSALELSIAAPGDRRLVVRLGGDILAGDAPQLVVPAGHWQQAQSQGDWTLAGCTVAPAFSFDGFELAPVGFEPTR